MAVELEPIAELCRRNASGGHSLVMLLQDVQERYGYLPGEALQEAGRQLGVPLSRLYGLATFYRSFSFQPRGRHEICLCTGTACHVRGTSILLGHLKRTMAHEKDECCHGEGNGERPLFSLSTVNCLGACALGPIVTVDGEYHGKATVAKVDKILEKLRREEADPTR